jgi:hypothetical protein
MRNPSSVGKSIINGALIAAIAVLFQLTALAHGGAAGNASSEDPAAEALIHSAPGAAVAGEVRVAEGDDTALLQLRIVDRATDAPTYCRVNVIGADGNYYEPTDNPLAAWSLQRLGNRKFKGPFRYYGWFFYSDGEDTIRVPAGEVTVEVWKGFEYRPVRQVVTVAAGEARPVTLHIERTLDMAAKGWYSGDPHIHLNRRDETEAARALDLMAAEDIRNGFLLGMNDAKTFNGVPEDQIWPQLQGMGDASVLRRGDVAISSGYEYRNSTYGHILLLMADDLVFRDQVLAVDEWPTFAKVAEETHRLNGAAIHAHGGYEKEIYADYIPGATDGVELLQFAVYRGIGLEGWYHILNAGYPFSAVGASDFPYCRALGDCRTYVSLGEDTSMGAWTDGLVAGKSFFTTGPVVEFTVDGAAPGETLQRDEDRSSVVVSVKLRSEIAPVSEIDIIANGNVVRHFRLDKQTPAYALPQRLNYTFKLPLTESTWYAVRAHGETMKGLPDVEVHTNPVYVIRGGQPIANTASVEWLLAKLDERITIIEAMEDFERKGDVLQYFNDCRSQLAAKRTE